MVTFLPNPKEQVRRIFELPISHAEVMLCPGKQRHTPDDLSRHLGWTLGGATPVVRREAKEDTDSAYQSSVMG